MSFVRTCAIVPVKALGRAKRRLSHVLPDAARQRLMLTMLEDVLAALAGVESIDCVVVVTPDARVAALAQGRGATVVPEPGAEELNAAIVSGIAYVGSRGVGQALVLPADVPLATSGELRSLIQSRGEQPGVTLAPSHDSNGTNGLLLAPPNAIAPCYGPGSYLQHCRRPWPAASTSTSCIWRASRATSTSPPTSPSCWPIRLPASRYAFLAPDAAASDRLQPNPQGNDQ